MAADMELGVVNAATTGAVVWPTPDYGAVADSVRDLFGYLGLDAGNPLGRWIRPGMTVVVKPNWVKHEFGSTVGRNVLFTHASLVRTLIDAALVALAGHGRVYVADAPLQGCDFARFRRQSGLAEMENDYARLPVAFLDLRQQWADIDDASSYVRGVHSLAGDPNGYSLADLGARSRLVCFGVNAPFGVTDYSSANTNGHHHGAHRYSVSNTVLSADVILNVPKLKTHMKTGMTGALKNFVGIIGSKDFLPHFPRRLPQRRRRRIPGQELAQPRRQPRPGAAADTRALVDVETGARGRAGGFVAADSWRRLARQRYALAHHTRPGGYRAQLRCRGRSAAAAPHHPDAGGCHRGGRRLRPFEAASQAMRAAGMGRRSRHRGCDLRHADGFRLAQDSAVTPSVRYRGASIHRVSGRDAHCAARRRAVRGAGRLVWRD